MMIGTFQKFSLDLIHLRKLIFDRLRKKPEDIPICHDAHKKMLPLGEEIKVECRCSFKNPSENGLGRSVSCVSILTVKETFSSMFESELN